MTEKPTGDDVLRRMVKTPPTPHMPKDVPLRRATKSWKDAKGEGERDDPNWTKDGRPKSE